MSLLSLAAGFGLGLSLIVALGAQNLFVLRQGMRREHLGLVVVVCAASDAVLIAAGAAGMGWVLDRASAAEGVVRILAAAYLLGFGLLAGARAWAGGQDTGDGPAATPRRRAVVLTALALTWLNPHVYLDTVLLLGSVAATRADGPWTFAAGAMLASVVWFSVLGLAARGLAPLLRTRRAARLLDTGIAVVMIALAAWVALPVLAG